MEWAIANLHRLKQLWKLCHGSLPMRWNSIDQKPSYFNNAAATGTFGRRGKPVTVREKFAASRERYTICTTVQAETYDRLPAKAVENEMPILIDSDDEEVKMEPPPAKPKTPKFAIMFKGAKDGKIIKDLRALDNPDFLLIQVQEYGSYRSEDVVEALEWMLPRANDSTESMVVMLDWYSGHRTEEVRNLIKRKGHVLLFHGGGTTPFTQTNDTHLHAIVQYLLVLFENQWARSQATFLKEQGLDQTPKPTREAIVQLCTLMWTLIDHANVAEKAYRATGPGLPLEGPISREAVGKELRKVWDEIDPGRIAGELGTEIRKKAIDFVNAGWEDRKWTCWEDAYAVIEEHCDDDRPVEEGLEGFEYDQDDPEDPEDDASDASDGPPGDDNNGGGPPPKDGDQDDGPPGDCGSQPKGNDGGSQPKGNDDDGQDTDGDDGQGGDGAGGGGPHVSSTDGGPGLGPSSLGAGCLEDGSALVQHSGTDTPIAAGNTTPDYLGSNSDEDDANTQQAKRRRGLSDKGLTLGPPLEEPPGSAVVAFQSVGLAATDLELIEAQATEVLLRKHIRLRDDTMVKRLLETRKQERLVQKQGASEIGLLLAKKAEAEFAAAEERKRANLESKRLRELEVWDRKAEDQRLKIAADEMRNKHLNLVAEQRREERRRRKLAEREKVEERWLQIDFPVELARRCIDWYGALSQAKKQTYTRYIEECMKLKVFDRRHVMRDLWAPVKDFTVNWTQHSVSESMDGRRDGTFHWVRCSAAFAEIINEVLGVGPGQRRHAPGVLEKIFKKIIPKGDVIFGPHSRTSSNFLLGHNGFIIEKAFVYGVICLSKWLGEKYFPPGLYGLWPPQAPSHLHLRPPPIPVEDEEPDVPVAAGAAAASSGAGP